MVSCINLILLVILFECSSILIYILSLRSFYKNIVLGEAVIKYILSSGISSSIFYLGLYIFLAGYYFSLNYVNYSLVHTVVYEFLKFNLFYFGNNLYYYESVFFLILGLILLSIGFLFKFGLVPFHFWVADLYQVITLPLLSIFMILPKISLLLAFLRIFL